MQKYTKQFKYVLTYSNSSYRDTHHALGTFICYKDYFWIHPSVHTVHTHFKLSDGKLSPNQYL